MGLGDVWQALREAVRTSISSWSLVGPWGPSLKTLSSTQLNSVLKIHFRGSTKGLTHDELVSLARAALWQSFIFYGVPLLLCVLVCLYLMRAQLRSVYYGCREFFSRRPQWLLGKFLIYFTSILNFVLTLSTILSWTQQRHGFPRSFFEWILKPVYATLEFVFGSAMMDFATRDLGVNIVPLVLGLLCTRLNNKLRVWMTNVREWEEGEGWVAPGQFPPLRVDLGNPEALRKLKAMGFDEVKAERALALSNNDIDMAAARLLEQR